MPPTRQSAQIQQGLLRPAASRPAVSVGSRTRHLHLPLLLCICLCISSRNKIHVQGTSPSPAYTRPPTDHPSTHVIITIIIIYKCHHLGSLAESVKLEGKKK